MSTYRPANGPPRRDSDNRSPDYMNDRYRSADSDRYRDRDRELRAPPRENRGNELFSPASSRRNTLETHSRSNSIDSKMDSDKASSEIAKLVRSRDDALIDTVLQNVKKDTKLKGSEQRLLNYQKLGGRKAHEPSVAEAYEKCRADYEREKENIEREITKANAVLNDTSKNYARILVKSLPIGEIKERQLIEAAKSELRKAGPDQHAIKLDKKVASLSDDHAALDARFEKFKKETEVRAKAPTTNDRTRALEEQMTSFAAKLDKLQKENEDLPSLRKTQEQQQAKLDKLQKENEELSSLRKTQEQQQAMLDKLQKENEDLRSNRAQYEKTIKAQLEDLGNQVGSRLAEFAKSLQEATTQIQHNAAPADSTSPQDVQALQAQVETLSENVKQLDVNISDFDGQEYSDALNKLLAYPTWTDLNSRIQGQQREFQRLGLMLEGLSSTVKKNSADAIRKDLDAVRKDLDTFKEESTAHLKGFSEEIVHACAGLVDRQKPLIDHLTTRVNSIENNISSMEKLVSSIEARTAIASRATSAVAAPSPRPMSPSLMNGPSVVNGNSAAVERVSIAHEATQVLREDVDGLRNAFETFKQEVRKDLNGQEMMIEGLDDQFKNMTTVEMAGIILDNLKKLLPTFVSLDVQNILERLGDILGRLGELESFRQNLTQDGEKSKKALRAIGEDLKMSLEPPAKRQRLEGLKGVNGVGAG